VGALEDQRRVRRNKQATRSLNEERRKKDSSPIEDTDGSIDKEARLLMERARRDTNELLGSSAIRANDDMLDLDGRSWKVGSPDEDPKESIKKVTVEISPIETDEERQERAATKKNHARISVANGKDETVLSEYLSEDINAILPPPIAGPDDAFDPGERFLKRLTEVAATRVVPPRPAPVVFETTPQALEANDRLLQEYNYDLEKLFHDFQDTILGYGSEFRPRDQLEKVLGGHPEFDARELD
jgi:hypothetical protein